MCQLSFPQQGNIGVGQGAKFSTLNDVKSGAYVLQWTLRALQWAAERDPNQSFIFRFETAGNFEYYIPIRRGITFRAGEKPNYISLFESNVYQSKVRHAWYCNIFDITNS